MDLFNSKKPPIPLATTAREMALKASYRDNREQTTEIVNAIREAAEAGNTQCTIDGALPDPIKRLLQERGYKITLYFHRNESFTKINW